jgi:2-amino-4-hydroxy-6-hydroxymethyldihydropteridine diphosphokinase
VSEHVAYVGLGSNVGDRARNLERAVAELDGIGRVVRRSSTYRTVPWGLLDQPQFFNAIAVLETELPPRDLLAALQTIERRLGRTEGERWGPRVIDLDLLLYNDLTIDEETLHVPHQHLADRAFVLVPLAELDQRFAAMRDALKPSELAGVIPVADERRTNMSSEASARLAERVRALASLLSDSDAVRVRIQRGDDEIELVGGGRLAAQTIGTFDGEGPETTPARIDTVKADLVGIFHLSRPVPAEGELLDGDRELGYIEALGIRTPVRSMGAGRLVAIATADDSAVEYGQPLFAIART